MARILKAGVAYAAFIFCIGFALGTPRVFLVVPRLGVRWSELLEMPLMLAASYFAARFILRQGGSFSRRECMGIGAIALVFMLLAEAGFVLIQGLALGEYIAGRDPLSGTAYLLSLVVFAAMPLLASLRRRA